MKNVKFIKEPGYVYDLFFIFALHFNQEYFLANIINYRKSTEDTDFFKRILQDYSNIPDELFPFFYIKENGSQCFMSALYHQPYDEIFPSTYNLQTVQDELMKYDQVITHLLKFYFMEIDDKTLASCKSSFRAVAQLINASDYNDTVKTRLYTLFLDPLSVIQKLSYELMAKSLQLSQYYEKNFQRLTELQNQLDIEDIAEKLKMCTPQSCNLEPFSTIYITFCLFHKNCVKERFLDNAAVLLLGFDYLAQFEFILSQKNVPELHIFANALAEKNRVEILEMIYRKGEITIKDIEQELGLTGTNAYYHLSLMIHANMLRTRNQGRTVLYSLNNRYFAVVRDMLSKYANQKERIT